MKIRKQRINAGLTEGVVSPTGSKGIPRAILVDVGRIIKSACHSFARAVDWQHHSHVASSHGDNTFEDLGIGHKLSENHEGLHSGRYISVSILRAANTLAIKGGYYDKYCQPKTMYKESVPLREVTHQALGHLLMEMHDRLGRCSWTGST